jgi:hypothetical protein
MIFRQPVLRAKILPTIVALEVIRIVTYEMLGTEVASLRSGRDLRLYKLCTTNATEASSLLDLCSAVIADSCAQGRGFYLPCGETQLL